MRADSAMGAAKKDKGLSFLVEISLPARPRTHAAPAGSELQRQSSDTVARFRPIVPPAGNAQRVRVGFPGSDRLDLSVRQRTDNPPRPNYRHFLVLSGSGQFERSSDPRGHRCIHW